MGNNKITFSNNTRSKLSNPHQDISHDELLRMAEIKKFISKYIVVHLPNGKIVVEGDDEEKNAHNNAAPSSRA